MTKEQVSTDDLIKVIIKEIKQIKGEDILLFDLYGIENMVFKYFIICTGSSSTHVSAICNYIKKAVSKELKDKPLQIEGQSNSEWVLMDYVDVVVSIFQKHIRDYYDIESLWNRAKITRINTE